MEKTTVPDFNLSKRTPCSFWAQRTLLFHTWLSVLCFFFLVTLSQIDLKIAQLWTGKGSDAWKRFMNQSLFEGHAFGASDLPQFLLIGSLALYAFGAPILREKNPKLLVRLGFINLSGLWIASFVHIIKGASHRPRPFQTLEQGLPFYKFYELGSWSFQGWGHGSFPSGHTATMMSLIVFAYVFPKAYQRHVLIFTAQSTALIMAASRVMVGAHWLSDTLGSMFLVIICSDIVYRLILRVPDQLSLLENGRDYPHSLTYWEIKLLPRMVAGLLIPLFPILIGNRYNFDSYLFWAALLFAAVVFYSWIRSLDAYRNLQLLKLQERMPS